MVLGEPRDVKEKEFMKEVFIFFQGGIGGILELLRRGKACVLETIMVT